jgi:hypothetical protein
MEQFELVSKKKEKVEIIPTFKGLFKTEDNWNGFQLFRIVHQKMVVYEFFSKEGQDIKAFKFRDGVFYWQERLLGYFFNGVHLQARADGVVNVCNCDEFVAVLKNDTIFRFDFKYNSRIPKGFFRLKLQQVTKIQNLYQKASLKNLSASFFYGKVGKCEVIASFQKVFLIVLEKITQVLNVSSNITAIKSTHLESINKEFLLVAKEKEVKVDEEEFKPEKKTLLALTQFYQINEVVDLFFFKELAIGLEKKMMNDWHLDPLDRSYLASDKFYQEQLYDFMQAYLNLTVQGLFLTNPDKLLMLQEALREQESRIYGDGHLMPDKTIASLITSSLPLPSSYDTGLQSNVRSLFLNSLKKN